MVGMFARIPKGPPRPGLVPQTGDPNKPGRWIRPESEVTGKRPGPTTGPSTPLEAITVKAVREATDESLKATMNKLTSLEDRLQGERAELVQSGLRIGDPKLNNIGSRLWVTGTQRRLVEEEMHMRTTGRPKPGEKRRLKIV